MRLSIIREACDAPAVQFKGPESVAAHWKEHFGDETQEHFRVYMLDSQHRVLGTVLTALGGLNAAVVSPRDAFRAAVLQGAEAVILVHNHPSGDPGPSEDDKRLHLRFEEGAKTLGIQLLDSIVIGSEPAGFKGFTSLREEGLV